VGEQPAEVGGQGGRRGAERKDERPLALRERRKPREARQSREQAGRLEDPQQQEDPDRKVHQDRVKMAEECS